MRLLGENPVDLLITDFAMPGMTGGELAEAVQAGWPDLPVVMTSGYAEIPNGAALGVPRLPKPFRTYQLAIAIAETAIRAGAKKILPFPGRQAGAS
jgi:CheY-like chemotaxis protein